MRLLLEIWGADGGCGINVAARRIRATMLIALQLLHVGQSSLEEISNEPPGVFLSLQENQVQDDRNTQREGRLLFKDCER